MELIFDNVVVDYPAEQGQTLRALDHLNLRVGSGEALAVIGPSGCGKSTSLRLASGLMQPSEGAVLANGAPVERPRQDTALILQDFGLLPWKNAFRNAELGLLVHKVPRDQRKQRTMAALESVGLKGFEKSYPSQLSGGMKQRLALARAVAMDVDLLLMDEPLSALDALLREEMQNMLLHLWRDRGYTQVLVTHSIEEAVFLGQRIVVMAPRPSRVIAEIENPQMGDVSYRSSEEFFARCRQVREALADAAAADAAAADAADAGAPFAEVIA